jgi:hypothetical protein
MPEITEPKGVGDRLVRLADVPYEVRHHAVSEILRGRYGGAKTPEEAERLMRLIYEPGDFGGRIAA